MGSGPDVGLDDGEDRGALLGVWSVDQLVQFHRNGRDEGFGE